MRSFRPISKSPMIIAAALMLAIVGCSSDPLSDERDSLNDAKGRWAKSAIADYSFRYRKSCFCGPDDTRGAIVTVRNGMVSEAIFADTREPVPPQTLTGYRTIDGIFALIQDAVDRKAATLTVSYDKALGYPTSIAIDYIRDAADDELGITVDSLQTLR